ncbi:MAG: hypothetical protein K6G12_07690 [Lachnospiraceae bacterium]|nr:hypothetical protein [Lachnospiraceae bacterium]
MAGMIDISELINPPEKNELETAKYFSDLGKDIKFLRPSSIPNQHTPDIRMDGLEWEMKAPTARPYLNKLYVIKKNGELLIYPQK